MAYFSGFVASDFDAFAKEKWSSHAFNRERLEVKLKLSALGKTVFSHLDGELTNQETGITEERPSIFNQHEVKSLMVFCLRDEESRRDLGIILDRAKSIADHVSDPALHHRHVNLAVRIDHQGVEAGLWLHRNAWVDWKNLQERCKKPLEGDNLRAILAALPDSVGYSCAEDLGGRRAIRDIAPEEVVEGLSEARPWSFFGCVFERNHASLSSEAFPEELEELLVALVPLYFYILWRPENDFHQLSKALEKRKEREVERLRSIKVGDDVRILKGLAAGRVGVVEALERKGVVKVRLGTVVIAVKAEELVKP